MPAKFVGAPIKRLEAPRLLQGQGTFIEDLPLPPGALCVALARSVYPHAGLVSVDLDAARTTTGVVAAFQATSFDCRELSAPGAEAPSVAGGTPRLRPIHTVVTHPALRPCAQPPLAIPFGVGTYASRNAVVAGSAALVAARQVQAKAFRLAVSAAHGKPLPEGMEPGLEASHYFLAPRASASI